jgi:hypothetical protein
MAVTKQTYTVSPTWTAAQLADAFRDAFIDAGLMSAWFDSFTSGSIENRILEIDYGSGTYEKTYYWFMFTTTGVWHGLATGWNATTHVPTGTQYRDYYDTVTNATTSLNQMTQGNGTLGALTLSTDSTVTITRFSSAVTSGFAWFRIAMGTNFRNFHIPRAGAPLQSWIDLSKTMFHHFLNCDIQAASQTTVMYFREWGCLRRSFVRGGVAAFVTDAASFNQCHFIGTTYQAVGNIENGGGISNNLQLANNSNAGSIILPFGNASVNPAYSTDYNPVWTGLPYSPYINENLPSDFGIGLVHNTATAPTVGDQIIVTNAVEVWEFVACSAHGNDTRNNQGGLVARVI